MSSSLFSLLNRARSTAVGFHDRFSWTVRFYGTDRYSRIVLNRNRKMSLAPQLDRWIDSGKSVQPWKLLDVIQRLRKQRRFSQALEISEWMRNRGVSGPLQSYHSIQLDLVGKVHGLASAESYFNSLSEEDRTERVYGTLLNCYIRKSLPEKSLSHMQKMKELGFVSSVLPYKDIMSLYTKVGQYEKVPDMLTEMKENGILPDNFSYRISINSYGKRSDFDAMEKILEEMTQQEYITMDWNTYTVVANHYIKAGLSDKAIAALKKAEEILLEKPDRDGFDHLFSLYGNLGSKSEVLRLKEVQESVYKEGLLSRDYCTFIGALLKCGELEDAKLLLKEWESSGNSYDFRLPDMFLIWYCQQGLVEKAVEMLDEILLKGKTPPPNSYAILASGYMDKGDMGKAVDYMKSALSVFPGSKGWGPNLKVATSLLNWLGKKAEIEQVESFVGLLRAAIPINKEMYLALIKTNVREGKEVDGLLKSMEDDKIEVDEEMKKLLAKN
ncbi:hypothetical protein MRB53_004573 [Persea americana]|uniref:Uncharacterized protein n=1 Tax=Persea americana TaxID=3435 RepID=A0ACC2MB03_PERAE|nr:hypothetical protein MRB53_004573 [Persea americana]|eukprot:TRINITY_DN38660_c0_g1_i1.p1 TRINITY_DN38660_c0_g1~~TRINITY_DN38660_c0_g1_i1.p1  ORF type:complete len:498 (-),score=106.49 TRINITY_DN38660_c0_g1_i1:330-1823(-)